MYYWFYPVKFHDSLTSYGQKLRGSSGLQSTSGVFHAGLHVWDYSQHAVAASMHSSSAT